VTDIHGNASSCSFTVVVEDNEDPVVTCPVPINPYAADPGECYTSLSFAPISSDNCGVASTTYSVGSGAISFPYDFPIGSTLVNTIVTDVHGNTTGCSFTVEVIDEENPVLTCPIPANPYSTDEGDCDATLSFNAVTTDNCGVAGVVYSIDGDAITFPYDFPVGTTVVSAMVTDIHGNISSCLYTVVVEDDELPIVTCPQAEIEYTADGGECDATLSFEVSSTDNCGVSNTVYKIGGEPITFPYDFPIGSTMVSVHVTDINGNTKVCTFTIIVEDYENPIITCEVPAESYAADSGDCDATLSFTSMSTDNCGIAGTEYSIGGNLIDFPYDFPVGTTEVNALAVDYYGNTAACFFVVTVTDAEAPEIVCPEPLNPYPTDPGNCHAVLSFEPYATDNCGVANTVYTVGESSIDFPYYFPVGSTVVVAMATDIYGNASSCSFTVIVEDQENPVVECPVPNNPYQVNVGECHVTLGFETFSTDNCGSTSTVYTVGDNLITFPYDFPVGSTVVTAVVSDLQGNITSCNFTIVVEDHVNPEVECPVPQNPYPTAIGLCHAVLSFEVTATDNCAITNVVYSVGEIPIIFPNEFPVGSTTVNVLVQDIHGNSSTCSFTVIVEDVEAPVVNCPTLWNAYPTNPGECIATLSFVAVATDNCEVESTAYSIQGNPITFPYDFEVGSTAVNVLVTDIHGHTAECTFTVLVEDTEHPSITFPMLFNPYTADPGQCNATLSFTVGVTDNCAIASTIYNVAGNPITFPYDFVVGSTNVNVLVTDVHGNSAMGTFVVEVDDGEHPLVTCPLPLNSYTADAGQCNATLSFDVTATDNCAIANVNYSVEENPILFPYDFPVGSTTVNVAVTDPSGNSAACYFVVVVEDNEIPEVECPTPSNPYAADPGECTATLSFEANVADNCDISSIVYKLGSSIIEFPYAFPVGSTELDLVVTDIHGNSATCSYAVSVEDIEPPVITCPIPLSSYATFPGDCYRVLSFASSVTDNCGVSGTTYKIGESTITFPYNFPVGSTTVSVLVTDIHGNASSCSFTVVVEDNEDPVVTCPVPINPYAADPGECYTSLSFAPISSDNCGVASTTYSVGSGAISFPYDFPIGSTLVNTIVTDVHGNTTGCSFTVEVIDEENPVLTCPIPANPYSTDEGDCDATLSFNAVTTDNCGVAGVVYSIDGDAITFPYDFPVGTTVVSAMVTDIHGNISSCLYTVVVEDDELPIVTCPQAEIEYTADGGECDATLSFEVSSTDNCGVSNTVYKIGGEPITFPYDFPIGSTMVSVHVTDINGNTKVCTFTIIVEDYENPIITCEVPAESYAADSGDCDATLSFTSMSTDNCGIAGTEYSIGGNLIDFPYDFPVGTTEVNALAVDYYGNTAACFFVVTVTDAEAPEIVCPEPLNPYPTDPGNCHAVLSFEPYATDNCGVANTVYTVGESSIDFPYYFPVGSTVVVAMATDIYGNASSCSFTVIVEDQENPVVECPVPNNPYQVNVGECHVTLGFETFSTDNCGSTSTVYTVGDNLITFPYDFPVGSTVVTAVISDLQGNITSCNFTIVVEDHVNPEVECPVPQNPYATDAGECSTILSLVAATSDNCEVASTAYSIGEDLISFPYEFPVGLTVVDVLVTDSHGNTAACSYGVVVVDVETPTLVCPLPLNVYSSDAGDCSARLSFAATAMDNCGISSLVYSVDNMPISFPHDFAIGSTSINVLVTDMSANTATCNFAVIVEDDEPPLVTCPTAVTYYTADLGDCSTTLSFEVASTDNCGVATTVYSIGENLVSFPYVFAVGTTTVQVLVTDIHGNSTLCSFQIVVIDNENPLVVCPVPAGTYTADAGNCSASLTFEASASDNCGIGSTVYLISDTPILFPYNFPVGITEVNVLVTDIYNNLAACSFVVEVADIIAPVVTCPIPANPYAAEPGNCHAVLSFEPAASDNCGIAAITYTVDNAFIDFPYYFPVGTSVVNVLVEDIHGNTSACTFSVIIEDVESPLIACPVPASPYTADAGACNATLSFDATSTDNCGISGTVYSVVTNAITFPYDFPVGTTVVDVIVTDIHNNTAACSFDVVVEDNQLPVVECPMPANLYQTDAGECFVTLSLPATAIDNCAIATTVYSVAEDPITFPYNFTVGTTAVNVLVTDMHGNTATCAYTVLVEDNESPVVGCPVPTNPYPTDAGSCEAVLIFAASSSDNCGVATTGYTIGGDPVMFPYAFSVGATVVDVLVTDIHGNVSECSFMVDVHDEEPPVLECPTPLNPYSVDQDECNAILSFAANSSDNCGVASVSYSIGTNQIGFPFDFPVGSTEVSSLVTDTQGNTSLCSFTVVVEDNQSPFVQCPLPSNPYSVDPGECDATLSFEAGSADNCGIESIVYTLGVNPNNLQGELTIEEPPITFPYDFPVGSTVVNVLVTDIYGNTSACSFTVEVVDSEVPSVQCPSPANPYTADSGNCSATLIFGADAIDNCGIESIVYAIAATPITFPYSFPVGSTEVNVLVTDIHGNSAACSFTVEVMDEEFPGVTCPLPDNAYATDPGECDRTLSFSAATSDNCGIASVVYSVGESPITFPYGFPVGATVVNVIVSDIHGNATSCTFTIVVEDMEDPLLTCPVPANPFSAEVDECSATLSFEASSTDNCGIAGSVYIISGNPIVFPYSFPIGSTEVDVQVTDLHGNTSECTFTVIVEDNELPTIICPIPFNPYPVDAGECDATLSFEATVTDNCGVESTQFSINGDPIAFPYDFPVGVTVVSTIVTDIHSNATECSFDVMVADVEIPMITCNMDISQTAEVGACSASLIVSSPAVSDNCGVLSVLNNYNGTADASGIYPVGSTSVVWTVTDLYNNTNTCVQTITITDDEVPLIGCAPAQSQVADAGQCDADVEIPGPVTSDNCEVESLTNSYNGTSDASDNYPVGTTTITWTLSDIHGNTNTCIQTITITDTQLPTIVCAPDQTQTSDIGECNADVEIAGPSTGDNCGVATIINSYNSTADASDNYPVGNTMVLWTVTDVYGNSNTCMQDITVTDGENPVISCAADQGHTADEGECFAEVTVLTPSTDDNCGVASVLNSYNGTADASGNYQVGISTVLWTVTDIHGNTSTCAQLIIVTDDEDPSITCTPDQTQIAEPGACSADVTVVGPSTGDNCGVSTVTNSFNGTSNASGNYPIGMTTVLWTISDIHGNSNTCAQVITVTDLEAPVLFPLAADIFVECDGSGNLTELTNWLNAHGGASATDNCGGLTWSDDFGFMSDQCGMTGSMVVVFTVTDQSGNAAQTTASFTIVDTTDPILTNAAVNQAVECDGNGNVSELNAWLSSHGGASSNDICGMVTWSHDFNGLTNDCGETGAAVVIFTASDDCANTISTTATFTITDTQAPYWIDMPANETEECDGGGNVPGLNAWLNSFTAGDICGSSVVTHSFIQTVDACGSTSSQLYNFIATDACGNSISNTASFTITDTTDPIWVNLPANQTVECDGNGNTGDLAAWLSSFTADDLCSDVAVTNNFASLSNLCGTTGSATVTFTAIDECGNSVQQAAIFSIVDTSNPYWVIEPFNLTVECNGTGNTNEFNNWLNGFTADDNCGIANVTFTFISFVGGCGSTLITTVKFKATDECGNIITKLATFTNMDSTNPYWVNAPADLVVECDGTGNTSQLEAWLAGMTADDICGGAVVTHNYTGLTNECGSTGSAEVTFTATDECDHIIQMAATFTIEDYTIPMITFCPPDVLIGCDAENGIEALGDVLASDNCDASVAVVYVDSSTQGTDSGLCDYYAYTITRTFTATDACSNSASCVQVILVQDLEAPIVIAGVIDDCYPSVALAEAAALAATTISDDCDNMVTITVMTGQTSGCDSLITVTATDVCGNSSHVTYTVLIGCEVTNANDSGIGSLRNVLTCAAEGAEIVFDPVLFGQTIVLTSGEIVIDRNMTLNGLGMPDLMISGNNASRIFHLMSGYTFTANNLTLKDANEVVNGGAIFVEGTLNLENAMFINNFQDTVPKTLTLAPSATLIISGTTQFKN